MIYFHWFVFDQNYLLKISGEVQIYSNYVHLETSFIMYLMVCITAGFSVNSHILKDDMQDLFSKQDLHKMVNIIYLLQVNIGTSNMRYLEYHAYVKVYRRSRLFSLYK